MAKFDIVVEFMEVTGEDEDDALNNLLRALDMLPEFDVFLLSATEVEEGG